LAFRYRPFYKTDVSLLHLSVRSKFDSELHADADLLLRYTHTHIHGI